MKMLKKSLIITSILSIVLYPAIGKAQTEAVEGSLAIHTHQLVSKKRVGRSEFEYEFKLSVINNTDRDFSGLVALAFDPTERSAILDNEVNFGDVNRYFTTPLSSDTIKVRVDRRSGNFNPLNLKFIFDDNSAIGADLNQDGIIDTVGTYIDDLEYPEEAKVFLRKHAKEIFPQQVNFSGTSQEAIELRDKADELLDCFSSLALGERQPNGDSAADLLAVNRELIAIALDNKERLTGYLEYEDSLNSQIRTVKLESIEEAQARCRSQAQTF